MKRLALLMVMLLATVLAADAAPLGQVPPNAQLSPYGRMYWRTGLVVPSDYAHGERYDIPRAAALMQAELQQVADSFAANTGYTFDFTFLVCYSPYTSTELATDGSGFVHQDQFGMGAWGPGSFGAFTQCAHDAGWGTLNAYGTYTEDAGSSGQQLFGRSAIIQVGNGGWDGGGHSSYAAAGGHLYCQHSVQAGADDPRHWYDCIDGSLYAGQFGTLDVIEDSGHSMSDDWQLYYVLNGTEAPDCVYYYGSGGVCAPVVPAWSMGHEMGNASGMEPYSPYVGTGDTFADWQSDTLLVRSGLFLRPVGTPPAVTPTPSPTPRRCPPGWSRHGRCLR